MKEENHQFIYKFICICTNIMKQWQIILCVMFLCGISIDIVRTLTYRPMYAATTTAVINTEKPVYGENQASDTYGKTLDYIFDTQVVHNYVQDNIKNVEHSYTCSVTSKENANILSIQVISDTRQSAFYSLKYILEWYNENHQNYQLNYDLTMLEDIAFQESPIAINSHKENLKFGAMIGAILSIAILFLFLFFRSTITNAKDIQNNIDSRLFAKIPKERKHRNKRFWKKNRSAILIDSMKTSFFYKEALKKLRHRLEESTSKHQYKSILITSTSENEGKSSICANLAIGFGMKGYKVLIIDTDFRKPSLYKIFEISDSQTNYLNDYFNQQSEWKQFITHTDKSNVDVLLSKKDIEHAEEYCNESKMFQLIEEAKQEYDYVLIDSAPAGYLSDTIKLNKHCDCSLLVIKQNVATWNQINNTIHRLTTTKNNLLGVVYNASIYQAIARHSMVSSHYDYNRYYNRKRRD